MEYFEITPTNGEGHIEGFPDAAKVFKIEGHKAKRLADLALHQSDLNFALEYLEGVNVIAEQFHGKDDKLHSLRQGLWFSAIGYFMKCFSDHASRFSLNPQQLYKGETADAMEPFKYFKDLRNKHFIHDENSYTQSLPGAILNNRGCDSKIAKIVCLSLIGNTLDQNNYTGLHRVITVALDWVNGRFEDLCGVLTSELEVTPYDELLSREEIVYSPPKIEEIGKKRGHQ